MEAVLSFKVDKHERVDETKIPPELKALYRN
jgi:hypothetical protein